MQVTKNIRDNQGITPKNISLLQKDWAKGHSYNKRSFRQNSNKVWVLFLHLQTNEWINNWQGEINNCIIYLFDFVKKKTKTKK